MYCMLAQSPAEQLQMAQSLKAVATWWALTLASNLAPEIMAILSNQIHVLAVFKRCKMATACKGSWRLAKLQLKLAKQRELDPVGQFWSGWLGAEACRAEITSG